MFICNLILIRNLSMMDMKNLFKQLSDSSGDEYLYITPTTILMWFVGIFLILLATINGFF